MSRGSGDATQAGAAAARLEVEHKALEGEAEVGRHGAQAQPARGIHLGLAERTQVLVVALQPLLAQQRGLRGSCAYRSRARGRARTAAAAGGAAHQAALQRAHALDLHVQLVKVRDARRALRAPPARLRARGAWSQTRQNVRMVSSRR